MEVEGELTEVAGYQVSEETRWQASVAALEEKLKMAEAAAAQRLSAAKAMWRAESQDALNAQLAEREAQLRGDVARCKQQAAMLEETMQQQQQARLRTEEKRSLCTRDSTCSLSACLRELL